eukprot:TRINITY_DN70273_c0_g1_i1.p1 TRINITY_DN70273_c0_g1~~TRINITY_DN70273_c0_g1_i1.p1  ORF type:complete len:194 (+),score=53.91 TRINITY_DN70273_c0_g1_i1:84-584(+)
MPSRRRRGPGQAPRGAAAEPEPGPEEGGWDSDCGSDEDIDVVLAVRESTIAGAGQGLFLDSSVVRNGRRLLSEEARLIRRQEARQILNLPEWRDRNPVIQLNKAQFLDIRHLRLYKSNHATKRSGRTNVEIARSGMSRVEVVATRDIYRGEELLWEYSPTWEPPAA